MAGYEPIRVLFAGALALFRRFVGVALWRENDIDVVAGYRDGTHALTEAERTGLDVALRRAAGPNCDGNNAPAPISDPVRGCRDGDGILDDLVGVDRRTRLIVLGLRR